MGGPVSGTSPGVYGGPGSVSPARPMPLRSQGPHAGGSGSLGPQDQWQKGNSWRGPFAGPGSAGGSNSTSQLSAISSHIRTLPSNNAGFEIIKVVSSETSLRPIFSCPMHRCGRAHDGPQPPSGRGGRWRRWRHRTTRLHPCSQRAGAVAAQRPRLAWRRRRPRRPRPYFTSVHPSWCCLLADALTASSV